MSDDLVERCEREISTFERPSKANCLLMIAEMKRLRELLLPPPTLPITVREERMHPGMVKYHIEGLPRAVVIHHFTTTDGGPPHDHPWGFQSTVLAGGYVERVHQLDGSSETVHRQPDDTFEIAARHIHRIEELPTGDCWTLILPREHEQTSGFYEFREDGAWQRRWNEPEWSKV